MTTYNYRPGLGNVGSYQASGIPYVTSSLTVPTSGGPALQVSFPSVTRDFTVRNDGAAEIRVGFSAAGLAGTNYFALPASGSYSSPMKITDLFIISDTGATSEATVIASLTRIDPTEIVNNWSGSVGVG
jgi:hypothetical protein